MEVQFLPGTLILYNVLGGLAEWYCAALEKPWVQALTGSNPVPSAISKANKEGKQTNLLVCVRIRSDEGVRV